MSHEPVVDEAPPRPPPVGGAFAKKRGGTAVLGALVVTAIAFARLVYLPFEERVAVVEDTVVTLDPRLALVARAGASLVVARSIGGRLTITLERGGAHLTTRGASLVVDAGPARVTTRDATLDLVSDAAEPALSLTLVDGAAELSPRGDATFAPRALRATARVRATVSAVIEHISDDGA